MLKIVIIIIGVIELLIGIINSLIINKRIIKSINSDKNEIIYISKDKKNLTINELMSLEGVTYIFLASVSIYTNMNNGIVVILFIIIQCVFFSILLKEIKKRK